jgi:sulfite dehydrogenase (quinone) subunit SoeC
MSKHEMVGDSFRLGYRFQRHWDISMATAFFCGELGAGLFLVSILYEFALGMVLGLIITGIGKPVFHLSHMGVPGKSWRAILRPDRSWISRGLIAIVVFCGAGVVHTIDVIAGGVVPPPLNFMVTLLAGAAALVVMTYQGFAMAHSPAIALWSTAMMPLSSLLYALTSGVMLTLALQSGGLTASTVKQLVYLALGLLVADLIMLFSLLYTAYRGSPGSRLSAELLIKTRYRTWFLGVVVVAGLLLPLVALWLSNETPLSRLLGVTGVLVGFYTFRVLIFKAGVYEPVMNFMPA